MSFFIRGLKNSSILLIGRVLGMIISYITLIYIIRELTIDEYGLLTTVRTFVASFIIFSFGGISGAVMREGSKNISKMGLLYEKTNGFKLLTSIFALILCLLVLIITPYEFKVKTLIFFFSSTIITTSLFNHWLEAFTATESFKTKVIFKVAQPLLFFLIAMFVINSTKRVEYLLISQIFLQFLFMIVCLYMSKNLIKFKLKLNHLYFDKNLITTGIYFFIISFAGMIFMKSDVLMISLMGSFSDVGVYSVADRIAREGSELRTVIIAGFFPVMIKRIKAGPISGRLVHKTVLKIFLVIIIGVSIFSYNIDQIIITLFGNKYLASASILQYLIYFLAIEYTIYPYILLLLSSNGEKNIAFIYSILAIVNIILNYTFFNIFGLIGIAFSTITVFMILAIYTVTFGIKHLYNQKILI
tara:strand:- start:1064 stop:2308 length:1245 start_codon:yes stop_codon:yes gene_type:complete